jgi:hypothetical protein
MNTRKHTTLVKPQIHQPSLALQLASADSRLVIGAQIPSSPRTDTSLPYPVGDIFQENVTRVTIGYPHWSGFDSSSYCYYCKNSYKKLADHLKTMVCLKNQKDLLPLPSLIISHSCYQPSKLIVGAHEPQENLNQFDNGVKDDVALEWSFQLMKLKRG